MPSRPTGKPSPAAPKGVADTRRIMGKLFAQHPEADTELNFTTPYELLVATILSAQCTDERVNQVTPALFVRYPNARALARATTAELEPQIVSTGFFRAKSKSLVGMANALVAQHRGEVPNTMDALVGLPGVGRKTANVVLGHALGVPGLPVDRHVLRVSNRIGIASSDDPEVVEQQLCTAMPAEAWTRTSDTLIIHGRRICKPRPLCERCAIREHCDYYRLVLGAVPAAPKGRKGMPETGSLPGGGRAAKRRGTGRGDGASDGVAPDIGSVPGGGRAAKRRGTRREDGASDGVAPDTGSVPGGGRAAKRQGTRRGDGASDGVAPETGSVLGGGRAAKRRGTGRGGGAPRQTKR